MEKIRFQNETEMEVSGVTLTGDMLQIEVETSDVNGLVSTFKDNAAATAIMRYYVETDLLRGYAGYTKLSGITYTPNVVKNIDYNTADATTNSGFAEDHVDKVIVYMEKVPAIVSVSAKTEKNTADIDYIAMAADIEL